MTWPLEWKYLPSAWAWLQQQWAAVKVVALEAWSAVESRALAAWEFMQPDEPATVDTFETIQPADLLSVWAGLAVTLVAVSTAFKLYREIAEA